MSQIVVKSSANEILRWHLKKNKNKTKKKGRTITKSYKVKKKTQSDKDNSGEKWHFLRRLFFNNSKDTTNWHFQRKKTQWFKAPARNKGNFY